MSWRFRRSISLGKGVKLNIGKKGIGVSAGIKGVRVGMNSKGSTYTSIGIPGTGLSSVNYQSNNSKPGTNINKTNNTGHSGIQIFLVLIAMILILVNMPNEAIPLFTIGFIIYYIWSSQPKQKTKRLIKNAIELLNKGENEEAIKILKEIEQIDKTNIEVYRLLGGALHNSGKYEEAITYLTNYIVQNPADINIQLVLANSLYKTNKYNEAIEILQQIPEDFEHYLKAIKILGDCFAEQKKYDLAIEVFKKAPLQKRNLDDQLMELHYSLAFLYKESGDNKNALKHFNKVFAANANYKDVAKEINEIDSIRTKPKK